MSPEPVVLLALLEGSVYCSWAAGTAGAALLFFRLLSRK